MDKKLTNLIKKDLIQNKCYKLKLVQYNYDEQQQSYIILFEIIDVTEECPNEVANEVANEVNFNHKIEVIIPNNIATLKTGKKYIIRVIASDGGEQEEDKQVFLYIQNQNTILDQWREYLKKDPKYKNKLTAYKVYNENLTDFNTKFDSPYYVYGKFYEPEPINRIEEGGAPRKSRRARKSRKASKKSKKSGKKSRRNTRH